MKAVKKKTKRKKAPRATNAFLQAILKNSKARQKNVHSSVGGQKRPSAASPSSTSSVLDGRVKLSDGLTMPIFGLGVAEIKSGAATEKAVRWALEAGYRMLDTATLYENEASVGKA